MLFYEFLQVTLSIFFSFFTDFSSFGNTRKRKTRFSLETSVKLEKSVKKEKLDRVTWGNSENNKNNLIFLISDDQVPRNDRHRKTSFFRDVSEYWLPTV